MRSKEDIGNKHGLMMHDPIQSYHIGNAMDEYAIDVLEWFFSQQYHPGSVDVDARDSAEKTYKNYLYFFKSKNNESKA